VLLTPYCLTAHISTYSCSARCAHAICETHPYRSFAPGPSLFCGTRPHAATLQTADVSSPAHIPARPTYSGIKPPREVPPWSPPCSARTTAFSHLLTKAMSLITRPPTTMQCPLRLLRQLSSRGRVQLFEQKPTSSVRLGAMTAPSAFRAHSTRHTHRPIPCCKIGTAPNTQLHEGDQTMESITGGPCAPCPAPSFDCWPCKGRRQLLGPGISAAGEHTFKCGPTGLVFEAKPALFQHQLWESRKILTAWSFASGLHLLPSHFPL